MSTDHSSLDQEWELEELLNAMVLTTLISEDGERVPTDKSSSSSQYPRPSDPTTGRTMLWKSKEMVDKPTSE
jgi:hypothetical protein